MKRHGAMLVVIGAALGALLAASLLLLVAWQGYNPYLALVPLVGLAGLAYWVQRDWVAAGRRRLKDLMRTHMATIEALTLAIDAKDPHSRGHVRKVQAYALELAGRLHVSRRQMEAIRTAALLHDIGKLAIPDHLLNKPGKLSEIEFQKVKAHPSVAADILANVEFPHPVLPIIRHHHERWDGSGYPDGLKGEEIPLGARVLAVADSFDALTSDRVYRNRKSPEEACSLLEAWAGIQYDPMVVGVLRENLKALLEAGERSLEGPIGAAGPGRPACDAGAALRPWGGALWGSAPPAPPSARPVTEAAPATPDAVPRPSPAAAGGEAWGGAALRDITSAHREVFALYEIAQTLGSSLRLAEVLDLVVTKIGQLVPYHTCVIYLLEDTGETLSARFVSGAHADDLRGRALRLGEGITGWSAAQRTTRFSSSPELDLAGTSVDPAEYSTVAAFPLCHDGQALGVITLYFMRGLPGQDDHIRMMDIIAKLSAGAIYNSTVFAETQESALTDDLTNLPNTRYLRQVFQQETIRSQQAGQPMAFLEMDLDNFKSVNDRHGHQVGDRYLAEISRVLRSHLRERDILVRLSGDEFGAILPLTGFAQAALLCERLQRAVDVFSLRLDGGEVARSGLSVGIALFPQDGESFEELLMRADYNMYQNKAARKNAKADVQPNIIPFPVKTPGGG